MRVHPLVGQEAGAILGDAVAAHQADGLAQHVGAVAGVPQLGGRAEHVGLGVLQDELHQRIGLQLGAARVVRASSDSSSMARCSLSLSAFSSARPPWMPRSLQDGGLLLFQRVQLVEEARGGKAQRGGGLAGGPHVHQPVQCVLALLDALLIAHRAGLGALGSAEALALIANDRLDGREQLGRCHQADRHAGAAEDRLNDLAVVEVGDDDAVLDGVSAHDAAGRNLQVEDGIAGGGELVNQLLGRGSAVEDALVALFQNHHATALDARVVGVDGGGDEVGEGDVGDEAAALVHLQPGAPRRLSTRPRAPCRSTCRYRRPRRGWARSVQMRRARACDLRPAAEERRGSCSG